MQKSPGLVLTIAVFLLALQPALLSAQEWDEDGGWDFQAIELYARGDRIFTMSLGTVFPTVFVFRDDIYRPHGHGFRPVGGTGSLAFSYFLTSRIFVGGEIGLMFNGTVGGNNVFIIPIGAHAGWKFWFNRFEFPVGFTLGIAPQNHLESRYLGFFLRGWGAAYFRFNEDWSFGLNANWTWLPQRPIVDGERVRSRDVDGNMLGVTISARYHF